MTMSSSSVVGVGRGGQCWGGRSTSSFEIREIYTIIQLYSLAGWSGVADAPAMVADRQVVRQDASDRGQ
jgi:hypothetical protein